MSEDRKGEAMAALWWGGLILVSGSIGSLTVPAWGFLAAGAIMFVTLVAAMVDL